MKVTVNHIEGSRKGTSQQFDLPAITIGRDPTSTIAFDPHKDDRVSTHHANIAEQGGRLTITDLGSRNGTFVNGMRISGPTPLSPGALVQFGEGGPQVMVTFDAPAGTPAAAPPAPKKGGGGAACVVILLLGFMFLVVGAVVVFFLYFRASPSTTTPTLNVSPTVVSSGLPAASPVSPPTASPSPAAPAASPTPVAATPAAPAASPSPAGPKIVETIWKKLGVGTTVEWETTSHVSGTDSKSGMRYTVTAKSDDEATVKVETLMTGMTLPSTEQKFKTQVEVTAAPQTEMKTLEERDETITVPAGTFACHYTKIEMNNAGMHTIADTWVAKDVPNYVKSKSASDGNNMQMTSESVLTKFEKK